MTLSVRITLGGTIIPDCIRWTPSGRLHILNIYQEPLLQPGLHKNDFRDGRDTSKTDDTPDDRDQSQN